MKTGDRLYKVNGQKKKTVYDFALEYLLEKYDIRYDKLGHDYQIFFKNKNDWEILDVNSILIELVQSNIKITPAKVEILLKSHFIPKFNPLEEYFESLPP